MRQTITKAEILRGRKSFDRLFQHAGRISSTHLRGLFLQEPGKDGLPPVRVGIVVGRGVKRAVDRNRIKRLVRESYRRHKHILSFPDVVRSSTLSLIFIYTPRGAAAGVLPDYSDIEQSVIEILEKAASRNVI